MKYVSAGLNFSEWGHVTVCQGFYENWFITPEHQFYSVVKSKKSGCNAGDLGLIPGLGRSLGEGNDYPLQYSRLENLMDRGAWWATVQGAAKSWTRLSD